MHLYLKLYFEASKTENYFTSGYYLRLCVLRYAFTLFYAYTKSKINTHRQVCVFLLFALTETTWISHLILRIEIYVLITIPYKLSELYNMGSTWQKDHWPRD